jgi:hypothetical protein
MVVPGKSNCRGVKRHRYRKGFCCRTCHLNVFGPRFIMPNPNFSPGILRGDTGVHVYEACDGSSPSHPRQSVDMSYLAQVSIRADFGAAEEIW